MKEISLSDIKKDLPFKIQKNMWIGHLRDLAEGKYGYKIDYDVFLPTKNKNLQRPFCWNIDQKRELILSVIKGIDIQYFSVIQYGDTRKDRVIRVIDGKQRLSTLIDFYHDKFTIILCDQEFLHSELPTDIKKVYDMFDIHFNQTYEYHDNLISDDDKIAWFEQINFAGTLQDIDHLIHLKQ